MTQNFNLDLEPKHRSAEGNFSHNYTVGLFSIFLKADAKNNLFKIRYSCPSEFEIFFENISIFIQDKNLDHLLENLSFNFYSSHNCENLKERELFFLDVALLHMREALYLYRGDLRYLKVLDSDQIICRCMGIDKHMFKELFTNHEGKKIELIKAAQVSMICGECTQLVNKTFSSLVSSEEIYEGETFSQWREKIATLLNEFHFYSPKEFQDTQINLLALNFPKIEIELKNASSELTQKLAQTSLANYLGQELGMPLDITISFCSSFAKS